MTDLVNQGYNGKCLLLIRRHLDNLQLNIRGPNYHQKSDIF